MFLVKKNKFLFARIFSLSVRLLVIAGLLSGFLPHSFAPADNNGGTEVSSEELTSYFQKIAANIKTQKLLPQKLIQELSKVKVSGLLHTPYGECHVIYLSGKGALANLYVSETGEFHPYLTRQQDRRDHSAGAVLNVSAQNKLRMPLMTAQPSLNNFVIIAAAGMAERIGEARLSMGRNASTLLVPVDQNNPIIFDLSNLTQEELKYLQTFFWPNYKLVIKSDRAWGIFIPSNSMKILGLFDSNMIFNPEPRLSLQQLLQYEMERWAFLTDRLLQDHLQYFFEFYIDGIDAIDRESLPIEPCLTQLTNSLIAIKMVHQNIQDVFAYWNKTFAIDLYVSIVNGVVRPLGVDMFWSKSLFNNPMPTLMENFDGFIENSCANFLQQEIIPMEEKIRLLKTKLADMSLSQITLNLGAAGVGKTPERAVEPQPQNLPIETKIETPPPPISLEPKAEEKKAKTDSTVIPSQPQPPVSQPIHSSWASRVRGNFPPPPPQSVTSVSAVVKPIHEIKKTEGEKIKKKYKRKKPKKKEDTDFIDPNVYANLSEGELSDSGEGQNNLVREQPGLHSKSNLPGKKKKKHRKNKTPQDKSEYFLTPLPTAKTESEKLLIKQFETIAKQLAEEKQDPQKITATFKALALAEEDILPGWHDLIAELKILQTTKIIHIYLDIFLAKLAEKQKSGPEEISQRYQNVRASISNSKNTDALTPIESLFKVFFEKNDFSPAVFMSFRPLAKILDNPEFNFIQQIQLLEYQLSESLKQRKKGVALAELQPIVTEINAVIPKLLGWESMASEKRLVLVYTLASFVESTPFSKSQSKLEELKPLNSKINLENFKKPIEDILLFYGLFKSNELLKRGLENITSEYWKKNRIYIFYVKKVVEEFFIEPITTPDVVKEKLTESTGEKSLTRTVKKLSVPILQDEKSEPFDLETGIQKLLDNFIGNSKTVMQKFMHLPQKWNHPIALASYWSAVPAFLNFYTQINTVTNFLIGWGDRYGVQSKDLRQILKFLNQTFTGKSEAFFAEKFYGFLVYVYYFAVQSIDRVIHDTRVENRQRRINLMQDLKISVVQLLNNLNILTNLDFTWTSDNPEVSNLDDPNWQFFDLLLDMMLLQIEIAGKHGDTNPVVNSDMLTKIYKELSTRGLKYAPDQGKFFKSFSSFVSPLFREINVLESHPSIQVYLDSLEDEEEKLKFQTRVAYYKNKKSDFINRANMLNAAEFESYKDCILRVANVSEEKDFGGPVSVSVVDKEEKIPDNSVVEIAQNLDGPNVASPVVPIQVSSPVNFDNVYASNQ